MSQLHSTWLMPAASDEAALQSVVDLLSRQFGTPRFQAHLTLVDGVERSVDELAEAIRQAVVGIDRFQAVIAEIGVSDLYFRSFYAHFAASGSLAELHRKANALVLPGEHPEFMPHISLLYGADDTAEKNAARQHWTEALVGRPICFDRVCIASAGKGIAISDWKIRATVRLGLADE